MWYLSYLHLNTWLQPIINCVSKKCSPVKSGTQILSLGLFTKSPISNQTKAIVPKAVIWSSSVIWICKLMWIENQNKPGIYPKGGGRAFWCQKRRTTRMLKRWAETWPRKGFMLLTIILFLSNGFGAFSYQFSLSYIKITLWVRRMVSKNFQKVWKMTNVLMQEGSQEIHISPHITPEGKRWDLRHCTHPTFPGERGEGWNVTCLPSLESQSHWWKDKETDKGPTSSCMWESPGRSGWRASVFLVDRGNLPHPLSREGPVAKRKP